MTHEWGDSTPAFGNGFPSSCCERFSIRQELEGGSAESTTCASRAFEADERAASDRRWIAWLASALGQEQASRQAHKSAIAASNCVAKKFCFVVVGMNHTHTK